MSFWAGMRAGELAALRIGDVVLPNGNVATEVRLMPDQTKGSRGRVVLLGDKLLLSLVALLGLIWVAMIYL